jgi:hypothetical protein
MQSGLSKKLTIAKLLSAQNPSKAKEEMLLHILTKLNIPDMLRKV